MPWPAPVTSATRPASRSDRSVTEGSAVDDLAGLHDGLDVGVVGDVGHDRPGAFRRHGLADGIGRREEEVHRCLVRAVHALVDLAALDAPRRHREGDVLVAVVVGVELRTFGGWIEHAESDHAGSLARLTTAAPARPAARNPATSTSSR